MTIIKCDASDCLNIDKKTMICTLDEIELGKRCKNYKRDIEYLRKTWKYMYVPVYDDYAQGLIPVRVEEDDGGLHVEMS